MTILCPEGLDLAGLRSAITQMYARVADEPYGDFHFHRGPAYAARTLGYDARALAALPAVATRSFAGVGNPHDIASIRPGEVVLDVGCGAGMDLLLAAQAVGPNGRCIGVDMTPAMLNRAAQAVASAGLEDRIELLEGEASALPLEDRSVDVVISNGVLNLDPHKTSAFAEIVRVLRRGGRLLLADIVTDRNVSKTGRLDIDLWAG